MNKIPYEERKNVPAPRWRWKRWAPVSFEDNAVRARSEMRSIRKFMRAHWLKPRVI